MSDATKTENELLLQGLDGSNPLAFLAALGTLRALSLARPECNVKMGWTEHGGAWRPRLISNRQLTEQDVAETAFDICCHGEAEPERDKARTLRNRIFELQKQLDNQDDNLKKEKLKKEERNEQLKPLLDSLNRHREDWLAVAHPHLLLGDDTTVSPEEFSTIENTAAEAARPDRRSYADFVAALGCSAFENDDGRIADTALRTMSGAGHQHFLGFMVNLLLEVTPEHIHKALFQAWKYDDPVQNLTMRWDPVDDARYALQWNDPSGDPARRTKGSMLGANVLAVAGLPIVPSIPSASGLQTVGFTGRSASNTFWTWPIWQPPIDADTCQSLLAHRGITSHTDQYDGSDSRDELAALGVVQRFCSQRITVGKIRSFTPAEAL